MIANLSPLTANKTQTLSRTHIHAHSRKTRGGGGYTFRVQLVGLLTTWILVFLQTLATKTLQHMRSFAENVPKKPH